MAASVFCTFGIEQFFSGVSLEISETNLCHDETRIVLETSM